MAARAFDRGCSGGRLQTCHDEGLRDGLGDAGHEGEVRTIVRQAMAWQLHDGRPGLARDGVRHGTRRAGLGEDDAHTRVSDLLGELGHGSGGDLALRGQAGDDGADQLKVVAGREVAHRLVAGDQLAGLGRDDRQAVADLLVQRLQARHEVRLTVADIDPQLADDRRQRLRRRRSWRRGPPRSGGLQPRGRRPPRSQPRGWPAGRRWPRHRRPCAASPRSRTSMWSVASKTRVPSASA